MSIRIFIDGDFYLKCPKKWLDTVLDHIWKQYYVISQDLAGKTAIFIETNGLRPDVAEEGYSIDLEEANHSENS